MNTKSIVFTAPKTAELLEEELMPATGNLVQIKMEYTVISGGTERASIMAMPNAGSKFPKRLGYCGIGYVTEIGDSVQNICVGDRVLVYHGHHKQYNVIPETDVTKVTDDSIPSIEAAFIIISTMGLGGVRRLEVELGESAMVMGLGLLGVFAVQYLHMSGAYPLIAADPNPERRALALELGADFALDPTAEDFVENVKKITDGKGINACVEVTGISAAMQQALQCASWMGRISLLGCTRVSDCPVDYYRQVHRPGVTLIGAHNMVRPKVESYPHHWTHQDDCKAALKLLSAGRLKVKPVISRIVKPEQAPEIYTQLCNDPKFPMGTVFDWREVE